MTPLVFAVSALCSGPLQTPPYNPFVGQHDCLVVRNWDSSHIGKCESRDLHVYVGVGLVSLAFAKSDPRKQIAKETRSSSVIFFADQCVLPISPSFSSLPWPCLLCFFDRSFLALLKLIAGAPTRIGIGIVTPLGATHPLESTEVTCHLSPFFFFVKMTCQMRLHRGTHHKKQRSTNRTFLTHCKTARHSHIVDLHIERVV